MSWRTAIPFVIGLLLASPGRGQEEVTPVRGEVIVLPFANYTGRFEAVESVLPVFYSKVRIGGLQVVTAEELRPILREHRTRVVGEIGARAMDVLRAETGARFAVVGSIDVFEPERSLEVLVSARVIELESHQMVTAVSAGRIVQETERAFGRGRASEIDQIVQSVVDDFIAAIRPVLDGVEPQPRRHHNCGLVAVVPLDDYSSRRHGARVLENLLIAELVHRDWQVIEPGVIRGLLLENRLVARGGVSVEVMDVLAAELGTCFILTGEVEDFSLAPTGVEASVPRVDYGLRLVDARDHQLLDARNASRDGLDGESLLGRGREYSMARLARTSIGELLDQLEPESER